MAEKFPTTFSLDVFGVQRFVYESLLEPFPTGHDVTSYATTSLVRRSFRWSSNGVQRPVILGVLTPRPFRRRHFDLFRAPPEMTKSSEGDGSARHGTYCKTPAPLTLCLLNPLSSERRLLSWPGPLLSERRLLNPDGHPEAVLEASIVEFPVGPLVARRLRCPEVGLGIPNPTSGRFAGLGCSIFRCPEVGLGSAVLCFFWSERSLSGVVRRSV